MNTRFTPGPWIVEGKHGNRHWITVDNNIVAEVLNNPSVNIDEESEANARLIAAAPELLEALVLAYSFMVTDPQHQGRNILETIKTTINKAIEP